MRGGKFATLPFPVRSGPMAFCRRIAWCRNAARVGTARYALCVLQSLRMHGVRWRIAERFHIGRVIVGIEPPRGFR